MRTRNTTAILLWTAQGLLAALFLFAGAMKLSIPMDVLAEQARLPGPFLRFIAVVELLGAVGVVLPAMLRIRPELTTLAAAGLLIVMGGAVVTSAMTVGVVAALMPAIVGVVAGFVAYGRWRVVPIEARA